MRRLPVRLGAFWLGVGLTAAALMYLLQGLAADRWNIVVADGGGPNWPSLVRSVGHLSPLRARASYHPRDHCPTGWSSRLKSTVMFDTMMME